MEAVEALPTTGNRDHLREALGDLLLQVMFHARIAQEVAPIRERYRPLLGQSAEVDV